jgi:hypothetical protein
MDPASIGYAALEDISSSLRVALNQAPYVRLDPIIRAHMEASEDAARTALRQMRECPETLRTARAA